MVRAFDTAELKLFAVVITRLLRIRPDMLGTANPTSTAPTTSVMMAVGATGVVSVAANVAPGPIAQMCAEFDKGNLAEAQRFAPTLRTTLLLRGDRTRELAAAKGARVIEREQALRLGKDIDGNPVYLATSRYNLAVTAEKWPKVTFHATREHGEVLG